MHNDNKNNYVYVTSFVGNLGTRILIEQKRDLLRKHYSDMYIDKVWLDCGEVPLFNYDGGERIYDIETISKGGVLAALWKICDRNKIGLRYNLSDIPVLQGTIEFCNFLNLNPYRLLTENSYILISKSNEINNAKLIGETNSEKKRVRVDGEVEAFLTKCYKDELDRICKY